MAARQILPQLSTRAVGNSHGSSFIGHGIELIADAHRDLAIIALGDFLYLGIEDEFVIRPQKYRLPMN